MRAPLASYRGNAALAARRVRPEPSARVETTLNWPEVPRSKAMRPLVPGNAAPAGAAGANTHAPRATVSSDARTEIPDACTAASRVRPRRADLGIVAGAARSRYGPTRAAWMDPAWLGQDFSARQYATPW